jgi:hypothetical protein
MIGTPDDDTGFDPVQTINDYADYYGAPADLAQAVMQRESGGNHYDRDGRVLTSGCGYRRLMGMHPVTAAGLGLGFNADDPEENVHAGLKYLGQNLEEFDGNQASQGPFASGTQKQSDRNAPIPPAKQMAVDSDADEPVRLSTDTTTPNDLAATLPSLSVPDYEPSGGTGWAHVQRVDDFVEPNGKGGYRLKKGIDPQLFLQTLADRVEMSLGFNEATQARYFQQYGHRPISKFFYGIDPRNPGLTVDQILAAIETASDLKPGEVALPGYQGVPVFRSVMPPSIYAHYRQFLNSQPEVAEQRANLERDIAEQRARDQQTRVDIAMRQIRPYLAANPAFAAALLPEILGLFSETAGRNARQFEEEAIRKATLGWIDPTLPGKAEGEQYDTPGAVIGGIAGGALPMIGAYALGNTVGGPVGGGIATGLLPLIERRPDEPQYDIEQRAGEGLVQGATAGVLGPIGEASGAIAARITPGSRLAELLLKGPMVTGAAAALAPLGTGRPMTREQALQNLAFAYGMEVPGLIADSAAPPAESRSPFSASRNVVPREQRITGSDGGPPVVELRSEPANDLRRMRPSFRNPPRAR